jgi:hypothetical protein
VLEEVDDLVVAHLLSHVFPLPDSCLAAGLSLYPSLSLAYQSLPTSMSDPVFGMKSLSAAIGYTTHGRRLIR